MDRQRVIYLKQWIVLNAERGVLTIDSFDDYNFYRLDGCAECSITKLGFKIFTHYMRLKYRLFRYNPSYLGLPKAHSSKEGGRSQWNLTLMQSLAPRNIEQIVQILLDTVRYFAIYLYILRIISSLLRENLFFNKWKIL